MDFKQKLFDEAKKIDIIIKEDKLILFEKYKDFLKEYNKKVNLTSITKDNEIIIKHFVDSLTVCKYIENREYKLIDIGTGAGFPGVPIAIMYDRIKVYLLDSVRKKIKFLEELKQILNLNNINTIWSRTEDAAKKSIYREKFEISTSRAVGELRVLLEYQIPFLKKNGKMIVMKSDFKKEKAEAKNALIKLNSQIDKVYEFDIEYEKDKLKRTIIIINKIDDVDKRYPRRVGIPKKQPL